MFTKANASRCMLLRIPAATLRDLLEAGPDRWYRNRGDALPADAVVLALWHDCERNGFIAKVWSATYHDTFPGEPLAYVDADIGFERYHGRTPDEAT